MFLFFNGTATTRIYTYGHTLSLHDALPIWLGEIAEFQSLGGPALARQRRQLSGQGLDKRALARSVYTQHADARATAHHKLYVAQDLAAATVCAQIGRAHV